ncbi:MAG: ABC transporter permease [Verrucomicrobia bacterium]|nr:ABC transporter permease [Verrucomicrobiota bacterium]
MNDPPADCRLLAEFAHRRRIVLALTWQDLRNRYVGATFGLLWSFVQPLVMALILWFVFAVALRAEPRHGIPFIAWFLVSVAAYNFFAESLGTATQVFREYAFLVQKVRFQIEILPLVKILAAAFVHFLFLAVVIVFLLFNGVPVSWFWLQTLYYIVALILLVQGLSWITASLNVFSRDVAYSVQVLLQLGFWVSPVFWDFDMIPDRWQALATVLRLNPFVYIVQGYRHSLVEQIPFWADWRLMLYFWCFTLFVWLAGYCLFKKLKPQFADVL